MLLLVERSHFEHVRFVQQTLTHKHNQTGLFHNLSQSFQAVNPSDKSHIHPSPQPPPPQPPHTTNPHNLTPAITIQTLTIWKKERNKQDLSNRFVGLFYLNAHFFMYELLGYANLKQVLVHSQIPYTTMPRVTDNRSIVYSGQAAICRKNNFKCNTIIIVFT